MTFYITDSAVFIYGYDGDTSLFITVPSVKDEMKSREAMMRFEIACETGTRVEAPDPQVRKEVVSIAKKTRDVEELSTTDIDILTKALEHKADSTLR